MGEYSAALNTVVKWEKEFSCELEKVIMNGMVTIIKCSLCKKFEGDLNKMCSYTSTWLKGTKYAKKDSLKKYLTSDVHLKAIDLNTRVWAAGCNQDVLQNTPIRHGLTWMAEKR